MENIWEFFKETITHIGDFVSSTFEKVKESPLVMKIVTFAEDGLNATVPYVKNAAIYSVDKIKEHPYLFGFVGILLLVILMCNCCRCHGGSRSVKMMKAPGRNCRIPRAGFEKDPRAYFLDLRGKNVSGGGDLLV
ncbi:hypothetical protein ACHQM5_006690 [Ranunculus cassubicifolius]